MFEVESVDAGSPAERAGLKSGDRIISVNGEEFVDYIDYVWFCAQEKLKIKAERQGEIIV